jgi:competence protein ComEA
MDLNAAAAPDLEALPGIGPHTAEKIVAWRREHGPFGSLEALEDVRGVGPRTVARLEPLVEVRPPPVSP